MKEHRHLATGDIRHRQSPPCLAHNPHTPLPPSHPTNPSGLRKLVQAVPVALKGAFFSCGQNCAGAERFFVQEGVYDTFVQQVVETTAKMRQGPAVGGGAVDCGAMCMPGLAEKVAELVHDAVQHGAKVSNAHRAYNPAVTS